MLSELIDRMLGINGRRGKGKMCRMRRKWGRQLLFVWERRCGYCRSALDQNHFTVDHFVPRSCGGAHRLENWVPACAECNQEKASHDPYVWMRQRGTDVADFDARRERWCTYLFKCFNTAAGSAIYAELPGDLTFRLAIPESWSPGSSESG